jgi:CRISPR/Cas system-associated exonuclease Cas4 (RecB family)
METRRMKPDLSIVASAEGINWSYSKLDTYETCAFQFKLRYIDRMPEPPRPPDNPLERGNRIHDNLEGFVKGTASIKDNEARAIGEFKAPLERLQDLYAAGMATAEQNWFIDQDWGNCARDKVWLWSKLDFSVLDEHNGHAIVGDYKSGKSQYKAINHVQQLQLYAAVTAIRYEWAERITAELWYVDEGHIKPFEVNREEALRFIGRFDERVQRLYKDRFFRPNPNKITCAYCPFGPKRGTGICPVGV